MTEQICLSPCLMENPSFNLVLFATSAKLGAFLQ